MYVVTVALNEPGSVVVFVFISDPQRCVNRQGTAALGSIESDEPSLTAVSTPSHIDVTLVNNTKSSIILGFSELTILQEQKHRLFPCLFKRPFIAYVKIPLDNNSYEDTAISRKVVGKKVHVTIPKGSLGYDQYTVSDTVAVEPTFAASL